MQIFDVYPINDVTPVRGDGVWLWDDAGLRYLDMYGGHAVISIGHAHPHWVAAIEAQLRVLAFYSNSVHIPVQQQLAEKLGAMSGYPDHRLFLCNSGAEANENALKLASFRTGRRGVISFIRSFHGRTSAAVAVTDDAKLRAPVNDGHDVRFLPLGDDGALARAMREDPPCAVIVEGIQGVAGIVDPGDDFLRAVRALCDEHGAMLVLDEVQSGCGRTGRFFAHQHAGVTPDLITIAKGMGNGFPVAGVLIHPDFEAKHGMLGTTFGGNHLACAAARAVLEVIEREDLVANAARMGDLIIDAAARLPHVREVRGRGLMLGIALDTPAAPVRAKLLAEHRIFTGSASAPDTLRILPPLTIREDEAAQFIEALHTVLCEE